MRRWGSRARTSSGRTSTCESTEISRRFIPVTPDPVSRRGLELAQHSNYDVATAICIAWRRLVVRPAPVLTEDNRFFWDAAAQGRLVAQRCRGCGRLHHPPRPVCPACHSLEHEAVDLAGTGPGVHLALPHQPHNPQVRLPVVPLLRE